MCGAREAETTREMPHERNMELISMQVNVSKSLKKITKGSFDIRAD